MPSRLSDEELLEQSRTANPLHCLRERDADHAWRMLRQMPPDHPLRWSVEQAYEERKRDEESRRESQQEKRRAVERPTDMIVGAVLGAALSGAIGYFLGL